MIDFNTLTLGEVATIEDLSGRSISDITADDAPKGKALAAIAMVIKRRSGEPTFSWNQSLALSLDEATTLLGFDETEAVEEGKDEPSEKSAKKSKPRSSSTSE